MGKGRGHAGAGAVIQQPQDDTTQRCGAPEFGFRAGAGGLHRTGSRLIERGISAPTNVVRSGAARAQHHHDVKKKAEESGEHTTVRDGCQPDRPSQK